MRPLKTTMLNFGILRKFALQYLSKTLCINELRTLFNIQTSKFHNIPGIVGTICT